MADLRDGQPACQRRDVDARRTPAPAAAGLWLGHDLLAAPARLAGGRGLGAPPPRRCSTASAKPTRSTGAARVWTAPASRPKGGRCVGPNPTDRGKPGTKRHVVVERGGLPLAALLTGANRHDSVVFETCSMPSRRSGPRRATAQAPRQSPCRQGLRHPPLSPRPAPRATSGAHRPQGHRFQRAARSASLGGGAHPRLAATASAASPSARATSRYPSGLPHPRLCPHLLQGPPMTGFDRHSKHFGCLSALGERDAFLDAQILD